MATIEELTQEYNRLSKLWFEGARQLSEISNLVKITGSTNTELDEERTFELKRAELDIQRQRAAEIKKAQAVILSKQADIERQIQKLTDNPNWKKGTQ